MHRILILAAWALTGCIPFSGFVHDEVLDGPYRIVAVDTDEQRILCRSDPGGSRDCFGDGLPSPTLIAAGADRNYIVLVRRVTRETFVEPPKSPDAIEYYYWRRTADEAEYGARPSKIYGPLTKQQFEQARHKLSLPGFSRSFEPLP